MNVNDLYNKQIAKGGFLTTKEGASPAGVTASSGTYYAVQFVTDCTPSTFTAGNSTTVTGSIYPAGMVIYGDITAITCSEDEVYILYKN
jgi:hypothetical protein